jgi:hypothetical protein
MLRYRKLINLSRDSGNLLILVPSRFRCRKCFKFPRSGRLKSSWQFTKISVCKLRRELTSSGNVTKSDRERSKYRKCFNLLVEQSILAALAQRDKDSTRRRPSVDNIYMKDLSINFGKRLQIAWKSLECA